MNGNKGFLLTMVLAINVIMYIQKETPVSESLFNKVRGFNFIKNKTLAQVFSGELCELSKNTFSYRTPPVAASVYFNLIYV